MGTRLQIKEVFAASQDAVYHWRDEEGDTYRVMSLVHVEAMDGRFFLMPAMRPYSAVETFDYEMETGECLFGMKTLYSDPEALVAIVRDAGSIDPQFWIEYEPDTRSTEERFEDEFQREQFERMGWAA